MKHNEIETIKEEVRKEFQVERMILFSDAVFAIVITLMAIEIKLPHSDEKVTESIFKNQLLHLLPVIFAYMVSFFFIGLIWYRHLKIFSVVKSYDKWLVIHNMVLLFFVGLFPFGASIVSEGHEGQIFRLCIYLAIIMCCLYAQSFLQRYILIKQPVLREEEADITELLATYKKSIPSLISFPFVFVLVVLTYLYIDNPELRGMSSFWIMLIPITQLVYKKMESRKSNS